MRKIVALAVGTFCAFSAYGAVTATMTLTGVNNGANLGGIYTSPYFGTVTTGATTISTPIICDDFGDDSYIGETWTADATNLSTLSQASNNATLKWQGTTFQGTALSQAQEYMAAAILTESLLPIYNTNPTLAGEYGFAVWQLLDPCLNVSCTLSPLSYIPTTTAQTVVGLMANAVSQVTGPHPTAQLSQFSNVTIYSYDATVSKALGQPTGCGGTCPPPPQEFIVVGMPEPPMALSLAFYLSTLSVIGYFFRRNIIARRK
jgi:hypothetical protein